ncbi:MAG: hypothetical protein Q7T50_08110 [Candidatus Magasanikbacteria bacterium]|nr:hypothetical protein [Candidatus Magasanikbacteria bacterium]
MSKISFANLLLVGRADPTKRIFANEILETKENLNDYAILRYILIRIR